ncbi:MAG: hypothetical protein E7058_06645 [Lentisphaerae bacterium]|nr:hypothetical protein [Lentisphaerota bacterium]
MASFNQSCPHCRSELIMDSDWIGMTVECPVCHNNVTVSAPAAGRQPPPSPPLPRQSPGYPPPEMSRGRSKTKLLIGGIIALLLLVVIIVIFAFSGTSAGNTQMEAAQNNKQQAIDAEFSKAFADAERASATDAVKILEGIIQKYPDHRQVDAVNKKIAGYKETEKQQAIDAEFDKAFADAEKLSHYDAIKRFMKIAEKYPDHRRAGEVNQKIRDRRQALKQQAIDAEFRRVLDEADKVSYSVAIRNLRAIIKKYPSHPDVPKAEKKLRFIREMCRYIYFSNPRCYKLTYIVCRSDSGLKNTFSLISGEINNWRINEQKAKNLETQRKAAIWAGDHGNYVSATAVYDARSEALNSKKEALRLLGSLLQENRHKFIFSIFDSLLKDMKVPDLTDGNYIWLAYSLTDKIAWWGEFKKVSDDTLFYTLK